MLWFAPVALEDAAEVEDVCAAAMLALANSAAPVNKPSLIIETSLRVTASVDNRTAITARSYNGKGPSLGGLGLKGPVWGQEHALKPARLEWLIAPITDPPADAITRRDRSKFGPSRDGA